MKRLTCIIVVVITVAGVHSARGDGYTYVENFLNTRYMDALYTTSWWDTVSATLKPYPFQPTVAGSYDTPGQARGVAVAGDHAFVADYASGFRVIDISDPTTPVSVGYYDDIFGNAMDVVVAGDRAYVADASFGLRVMDISDPTSPIFVGVYNTPGLAQRVAVSGNHAYVADLTQGLQVIDISDPAFPTSAGSYDTPGFARGVAVSGDYAVVADDAIGVHVFDVGDPANPSPLGSCDTPGAAEGVAIAGDVAYVADGLGGLQVIDISDPENPALLGGVGTPDIARGIAITGDYAYVAQWGFGVGVVDITDPTAPVFLGSCDTPGYASGVVVSGGEAFVADHTSGLQVVTIAQPAPPTPAGHFDTGPDNYSYAVAISGDHAFVAEGFKVGINVVDISDPLHPVLVGNHVFAANEFTVDGDYLYAVAGQGGVSIFDVSDPSQPVEVGNYADGTTDMRYPVLSGDHLYVTAYSDPMLVIDVSDPTTPTPVGSYYGFQYGQHGVIDGDHGYFAAGGDGLEIVDISDPTAPVTLGTYDTPGYSWMVAVDGDWAYVADAYDGGLQVIDISDPTAPVQVGSYDTPYSASSVAVSGNYLLLGDGGAYGVHGFDITDPTNPILRWSDTTPNSARDMEIAGDYVYIADASDTKVLEVFERTYQANTDTAQSVAVDSTDATIVAARLTTAHEDSIQWELSVDDGATWVGVQPGGPWHEFAELGSDLKWRAAMFTGSALDPSCTEVKIEYVSLPFHIESIEDVPGDQGHQVHVAWSRCGYDFVGSSMPITRYVVYRKVDDNLVSSAMPPPPPVSDNEPATRLAYPPGDWDYVAAVPASSRDHYSVVVPTIADSTVTDGMYRTTFFVSAFTETPGVYMDSPVDSGYSSDNLPPAIPQNLTIGSDSGRNALSWDPCPDEDFVYFHIYRGPVADFAIGAGTLAGITGENSWTDPGDHTSVYYKVTAVDDAGNESAPSGAGGGMPPGGAIIPVRLALYQNVPNPFNPKTTIIYDVPAGAPRVTIDIFDTYGHRVRQLVDRAQGAGRWTADWDGTDSRGQEVASGVYFCRLIAGDFKATKKMVLLK
jgi:hypothetical protein